MPQKCPKNKRSQITPPAKIRNRNHYNKGFWRALFFQFESDYLHRKPLLNMFRGGFLILYPKSYPKNR